jgi:hypothetical protein
VSNVTPIDGSASDGEPPATEHQCHRFHLAEPDDAPENLRLIQALHGVCYAIERLSGDGDTYVPLELGTAAEILSAMLQERIESR